jgi:hypothetical protein
MYETLATFLARRLVAVPLLSVGFDFKTKASACATDVATAADAAGIDGSETARPASKTARPASNPAFDFPNLTPAPYPRGSSRDPSCPR